MVERAVKVVRVQIVAQIPKDLRDWLFASAARHEKKVTPYLIDVLRKEQERETGPDGGCDETPIPCEIRKAGKKGGVIANPDAAMAALQAAATTNVAKSFDPDAPDGEPAA